MGIINEWFFFVYSDFDFGVKWNRLFNSIGA